MEFPPSLSCKARDEKPNQIIHQYGYLECVKARGFKLLSPKHKCKGCYHNTQTLYNAHSCDAITYNQLCERYCVEF